MADKPKEQVEAAAPDPMRTISTTLTVHTHKRTSKTRLTKQLHHQMSSTSSTPNPNPHLQQPANPNPHHCPNMPEASPKTTSLPPSCKPEWQTSWASSTRTPKCSASSSA